MGTILDVRELTCIGNETEALTMKSVLIAAMLAVAAVPVTTLPSQAQSASITIQTGDGYYRPYHRHYYRHDNGLHRGWHVGRHRGWDRHHYRYRQAYRDCWTETVRYYQYGRLVIREQRVCD